MRHLLQVRTVASVAGLVVSLSCEGGRQKPPDPPRTHTISMELVKFQPEKITVKTGETAVWINKDLFPHTVVSKLAGIDSREVAAGASWTFTPKTPGEFEYVCTLHPVMKGVLEVK